MNISGSIGTQYQVKSIYIYPRECNISLKVSLAYDDDTKGIIGSKDVSLAYDDDTKGKIGFKDVLWAYDDDAQG